MPRDVKDTVALLPIRFPWLGKMNDQPPRFDLDTHNVGVDEAPIIHRRRWFDVFPNRGHDQRLDLGCRHSAYRSGALGRAVEQADDR